MEVGIQEEDVRYTVDKEAYLSGKRAYSQGLECGFMNKRLKELWKMGYSYAREMENV